MATNDFKAWAIGGSPNVESQASYAADANVTNGYAVNAIPPSTTLNKTLRQASFVAANIAQVVSDNLNANVLDDGNSANFQTNFRNALGYVSGVQVWSFTTTQFNVFQSLHCVGIVATGDIVLSGGTNGMWASNNLTGSIANAGTLDVTLPASGYTNGRAAGKFYVYNSGAVASCDFIISNGAIPIIVNNGGAGGLTITAITANNLRINNGTGSASTFNYAYNIASHP